MKQDAPMQLGLWSEGGETAPFPPPSPVASGDDVPATGRLAPGGTDQEARGARHAPPARGLDAGAAVEPGQHASGLPLYRHPRAEREIRLGKAVVAYEVKRVRRRSIGMVVGVDGLSVRAPRWVSWGDIESALRAKERWICTKLVEQRERARRQMSARIDWREGAEVPFLGESVVIVLDPGRTGAHLMAGPRDATLPGVARRALHLGLPQSASAEQIRDAAEAWLQREAKVVFAARVTHYADRLGVSVTKISLSSARTRWGSASADGSIRLHWRLVHFGLSIIDYVVAHELAHLREMNHSPRFWAVVRSIMPDYDGPRDQLRHVAIPD